MYVYTRTIRKNTAHNGKQGTIERKKHREKPLHRLEVRINERLFSKLRLRQQPDNQTTRAFAQLLLSFCSAFAHSFCQTHDFFDTSQLFYCFRFCYYRKLSDTSPLFDGFCPKLRLFLPPSLLQLVSFI